MEAQKQAQDERNCRGLYRPPEKMLDALCEAISRRKSHPGALAMAEIITVLFIAAFFFALGYQIGKGR